jgi:hypothetical protein
MRKKGSKEGGLVQGGTVGKSALDSCAECALLSQTVYPIQSGALWPLLAATDYRIFGLSSAKQEQSNRYRHRLLLWIIEFYICWMTRWD